jgi:hypothetical protein
MRTGQPIIGRPVWYDRNPTNYVTSYTAEGVAPHAETLRLTYTCPTGKKTIINMMEILVQRYSAATTAGIAKAKITYKPSGGIEAKLVEAPIVTNAVGDKIDLCFGQTIMLNPGDVLNVYTSDSSTGGTVNYIVCMCITTFDA